MKHWLERAHNDLDCNIVFASIHQKDLKLATF